MNDAKLRLSAAEMALVMDPGVILTKNSIIGKVVEMMARLSEEFRGVWDVAMVGSAGRWASVAVVDGNPKISKGENYLGLPYVMLDYPRIFGKEDVLAIRTMFWWGHAFIVTLHLKGRYKDMLLPVIRDQWPVLSAGGFHVGVSEDEWRHEHVPDNYMPVEAGGAALERALGAQPFLKISARCGLDRWEEAPMVLAELFRLSVNVVGVNSPADGRGPLPGSSRAGSGL